jgi:hypothetical protein
MSYKTALSIVIAGFLFLQGCGGNTLKEDVTPRQQIQEEQYQPYKLQNTTEGYKEFLSLYPDNMFAEDARQRIADLEFAPYKKAHTVEGYMEFKARYPDNPYCAECDPKIEQLECKRCEETDTVEAYKEFLAKYPDSASAERIQEKLAAHEISEEQKGTGTMQPLQEQSPSPAAMDGTQIMTLVHNMNRAKDYIITTSWTLTRKGRKRHSTIYMEKRKNLDSTEDFFYKSVVRYIEPTDYFGNAILTWNYKDNQRLFWILPFRRKPPEAKRTLTPELRRPPAEADFSLADYYDINLGEEKHELLRSELYEDTKCFVVESIPLNPDFKYGKRIIWIDQENSIPLKIEYYDQKGNPWKTLYITWQKKYDLWFWRKAEATNLQEEIKTYITIDDLRVNLGLPDRDFTRNSLDRKILGF